MHLYKQFSLFLISSALIVVMLEFFVRYAYVSTVSSTEYYEDIGRGRRKNLDFIYFNEGFGIGGFNQFRFSGKVESYKKSENTIRVALIGDSFVQAFQVFERDNFGNVALKILESKYPDSKIEFLNFGWGGADIGDMYAYQKVLVEKFKPDYILYFLSNEDLTAKHHDVLRPEAIIVDDSLKISMDFELSKIQSFKRNKFFIQNSAIFNMGIIGVKKMNQSLLAKMFLGKIYDWISVEKVNKKEPSIENLNSEVDPVVKKIVEDFDPDKFLIFNIDSVDFPNEFSNLCVKNEIHLIDLDPILDQLREAGIDPNYWEITKRRGHWNHDAHKIVGENIAYQLDKMIAK